MNLRLPRPQVALRRLDLNRRRSVSHLCCGEFIRPAKLAPKLKCTPTFERKSLLRLLHADTLDRQPRQQQRSVPYGHHFDDALRVLAETLDYVCAERLQPALPELALQLAATDLVHHCGATPVGDCVHTLQMIDVAAGWSERVAVLGRS